MTKRASFQSRLGFLVVAAGSAIGLGNIWRFPYLVGENGGGAFVLLYLFFAVFIGAFAILAEVLLGRISKRNAIDAFGSHHPEGKSLGWKSFGGFGLAGTLFMAFYYPIIAGWTVQYIFLSPVLAAHHEEIKSTFDSVLTGFGVGFVSTAFVIILTNFVVARGLVEGTEKVGLFLLPVLFILLVILAFRSLTLENASAGIAYYLVPDFSKLTTKSVLAALGQAFFSLSVGSGLMITFGSYMNKKNCAAKSSISVMVADTLVAFFAGLVIMPALFSYGISPSSGPGLVFIGLPTVFSHLTGGTFWAPIFFFLMFIAAFTSTIAHSESVGTFITEKWNFSRKKAMVILTVLQLAVMAFILASQTKIIDVTISGKNLLDATDFLVGSIMIPIGALGVCLYLGIYHRKTILEKAEDFMSEPFAKFAGPIVNIISFVLPVVIAYVLISGIM